MNIYVYTFYVYIYIYVDAYMYSYNLLRNIIPMFLSKEYYWLCVFPCFLIWAKSAMNECMPPWMGPWRKKRNPFPSIQTTSTKRLGEVRLRYTNQYLEYLDFVSNFHLKNLSWALEVPLDHWYPLKSRYYRCISEKVWSECLQCLNPNTFGLVLHFPIRVGFMVGATFQFQGFLDIKSAANPKAIDI